MKAIINPERLVSVPFNKTQCGVDFYINTGESKDICGVLTEHKTFNPNRSLEKASCHFLMTAIRKTALYMLDS